MAQEEFLLKWNDHHVSFFNIVEELCRSEQLCDITLACGSQVVLCSLILLWSCVDLNSLVFGEYGIFDLLILLFISPSIY